MTKATKKTLDKAMRSYRTKGSVVKGKRVNAGLKVDGWKGIDDPSSVEVWRNTPDPIRKELMNMMDVSFRDKGGLSIGATYSERCRYPERRPNIFRHRHL